MRNRNLRRGSALLYVSMIGLLISIGLVALLRLVGVASGTQARAETASRVQNAFDSVYLRLVASARANALTIPFVSTESSPDGILLGVTGVAQGAPADRLVRVDLVATYGGESFRRTEYLGLPAPPTSVDTVPNGLMARAWQTNGTDSWWTWPPSFLTPTPIIARNMTQFAASGASMSFLPDMPSPYFVAEGTITPTVSGSFAFIPNGDNHGYLEINGTTVYCDFNGFNGLPSNANNAISLTAGVTYRMTWIFMDHGIAGWFNFRYRVNNGAETPLPLSWVKPYGAIGGPRQTWQFTLGPMQSFTNYIGGNPTIEPSTPIDLFSMGFSAGQRIRITSVGGFRAWDTDPTIRAHTVACFSTTTALLPDQTSNRRITGAIAGGSPTKGGDAQYMPPEAFWVAFSDTDRSVDVTIPANGRYLFVGAMDPWGYSDNVPWPGLPFGYTVELAP